MSLIDEYSIDDSNKYKRSKMLISLEAALNEYYHEVDDDFSDEEDPEEW